MNEIYCPKCGGVEFVQGIGFMPIKPLNKKLSMTGSNSRIFSCHRIFTA
jgi:hypothetical protein